MISRRVGIVRFVGTPIDYGCILTLSKSDLRFRMFPVFNAYDIPAHRIQGVGPCLYRWMFAAPAIKIQYIDSEERTQTLIFSTLRSLDVRHLAASLGVGPIRCPSRWLWLPIVLGAVLGVPSVFLFGEKGAACVLGLLAVNNLLYRRPFPLSLRSDGCEESSAQGAP